jgi:hypothetical protein
VHATAQPPGRPPAAPTPPTPLLDAVLERGGRARDVPLHVPGHKVGRTLAPARTMTMPSVLRTVHVRLSWTP